MKPAEEKSIEDILTAGEAIFRYNSEVDLENYISNEVLQGFTERKLLIIGEAAMRIRDSESPLYAQIDEFRLIIGLRNRVVHGYDAVDHRIIWDAVQNHLPTFLSQIRSYQDAG